MTIPARWAGCARGTAPYAKSHGNHAGLRSSRPTHRTSNLVKTAVLLAAMTALELGVGQLIGGPTWVALGGRDRGGDELRVVLVQRQLALAMNRARPLPPDEIPWLEQLVGNVANRADLPMPKLYLVDSPRRTRSRRVAARRSPPIAITTGLSGCSESAQFAGVIAHELSH